MWIHVSWKGGDRKIEVAAAPFFGSELARDDGLASHKKYQR